MSSFDIPITVAPIDLNWSVASEKLWASTVQPFVNAFGKKYSTTGPFFRASDNVNVNWLPPMAACVVNSGARAPTVSAACALPGPRLVAAIPSKNTMPLWFMGCLLDQVDRARRPPAVETAQRRAFGSYSGFKSPPISTDKISGWTKMGARERSNFELTLKGTEELAARTYRLDARA